MIDLQQIVSRYIKNKMQLFLFKTFKYTINKPDLILRIKLNKLALLKFFGAYTSFLVSSCENIFCPNFAVVLELQEESGLFKPKNFFLLISLFF